MWVLFWILTIVAVVDRFTWNLWPRQALSIGGKSAGSDSIDLKEGPWTVKFYDVCARISGRYSIPALNLLLFTRCKTLMTKLSETKLLQRT